MIDYIRLALLVGFGADFLFSDMATGGMEVKHFLFWGALALIELFLTVGLVNLVFSCFVALVLIVGAEKLSDRIPNLGVGDWYFLAVSMLLFPFPVFYSFGMPVAIIGGLMAGFVYLFGTMVQLKEVKGQLAFAPFLLAGLLLAVIMVQGGPLI